MEGADIMTKENILLILCILLSILIVAGVFIIISLRIQYFSLYRKVQICQKALLEDREFTDIGCREGAASVVTDDFIRIRKKFYQEREEARADRDAVKELTSNLSHQLRTPLSNIRLYQDLLKSQGLPPEKRICLETRLEEQTDKLDRLLSSLFKMMDLERGSITPSPVPLSVLKTVTKAVESVLPKADRKNIRIEMDQFQDLLLVYDPVWTEEILINVLENAIKYSPENSGITLGTECFETYAAIRIKDNGPGIPKEEYNKIFQKFYRGSSSKENEGWGIGLYLSRLLLEKEHGYITVSSTQGEGSLFSVFLPVMTEL